MAHHRGREASNKNYTLLAVVDCGVFFFLLLRALWGATLNLSTKKKQVPQYPRRPILIPRSQIAGKSVDLPNKTGRWGPTVS